MDIIERLQSALIGFSKNLALNIATVIPAIVVGLLLIREESRFGFSLGWVIFAFLTVFVIQMVLMLFVRSQRHWVNSLLAMLILFIAGWFTIAGFEDPEFRSTFPESEVALLLNISTEFWGAAIIVILLQLKRLGVASAMVVGVYILHLADTRTGFALDVHINLASEVFGALLTGWVIYSVINRRDRIQSKQKEIN